MPRQQEAWGGDLKMPHWLRRLLHRPESPGDTPERTHEARQPQELPTVGQNADKALAGGVTQIYWEERKKARPRGDTR
jgi:hypothetical protein